MRNAFLGLGLGHPLPRAARCPRRAQAVQRRILYSMHGWAGPIAATSVLMVVGDVMGKYHPHGDQAIYDALVRMAADFAMRLPLVDGRGNFGSLDAGPAASRYTEGFGARRPPHGHRGDRRDRRLGP